MVTSSWEQLLRERKYPRMAQTESDVTRAWIRKFGRDYDDLFFQVPLGQGRTARDDDPAYLQQLALDLSRQRADIIAWHGNAVDIIEAKDRATAGAMGQLLSYRSLWLKEHPETPVARLLVIAREVSLDVMHVYRENGIEFEIVIPEGLP